MELRKTRRLIPYLCMSGLIALGLMMVNPSIYKVSVDGETYAAENTVTGTAISLTIDGLIGGTDGEPLTSSVNTKNGETAYISHSVSINASNINGYTLRISAASGGTSALQHDGDGEAIPGADGAIGETMPNNTWGYSWGETNADIATLKYYTLPEYGASNAGILESEVVASGESISFTKKLTFGAKFSGAKGGHYTTTALISLAAGATEIVKTWDELEYMQDMSPTACNQAPLNAQKTLTDKRDGAIYTIARIKNQTNDEALCWMTQNLRLVGDRTLTQKDSDVKADFILPSSVTISTSESPKKFSTSDTYQKRVYYANNTSYGAYYNWYTATAGTGVASLTTENEVAESSICPKGWRLPTGGNRIGEVYELLNGLGTSTVMAAPYGMVYGGDIRSGAVDASGAYGYLWSSTARSDERACSFSVTYAGINTSDNNYRYYGRAVRCVNKKEGEE